MKVVKELLVWLLALLILIPLFLVVINSFKSQAESDVMSLALPKQFLFENYRVVIEKGNLARAFMNSVIITVGAVILTNFSAAIGAYVLARRKTKMSKVVYYFFIIGLIAPINMIPTIKVMQILQVMNTYQGVILLYAALMMPLTMFLYYGFINTVPRELDESAVIDGTNSWQLFSRIIFPLLMPVTITSLLINIMNAWNDFIIPLYVLNKSSYNPMTLAVYSFYGTHVSSWNLVSAVIVLTCLPIVIIYFIGQRYLISGMTAGAIKG